MHSSMVIPSLQPDLLLSGVFAVLYLAAAVYTAVVPQGGKRWWIFAGALAVLVLAAMQVESALGRMLLLDLAALSAVALVWTQSDPRAAKAARTYLTMLVVSIACVAAGLALTGMLNGSEAVQPAYPLDKIVAVLLVVGFAMKLAIVPFYFWLPGVASSTSPMTTALIVATLDMAEFGELIHLREAAPWVFADHFGVWMALALFSMFGGALLALAQRDVKRMLAFSTIDDMGYLLLGVLIGTQISLTGAVIGMVSHALFKFLMFGAVGIAEKGIGKSLSLDCCGLSGRFPVSSAMFITGALGILGIPPLFGFAGRWRLYLAGIQSGGVLLGAAMAAATALALFYYVRAIHRVWLGKAQADDGGDVAAVSEPRLAAAVLIILAVAAVLLGLFPAVFQMAL